MSNNETEINSYKNENNSNENYKQQNYENCTKRQIQSAFLPPNNVYHQQTMEPPVQQQFVEQFQSLNVTQQPQYYPEQTIPPLPLNIDMSMIPPYYELQQPEIIYTEYPSHPSTVPLTMTQQISKGTMRSDAPPFLPSSMNTNSYKTETNVNKSTPITENTNIEIKTTNSFIYDLKKYKYNYFLSKLSYNSDRNYVKFGSPTGICTLNDDRLLVANFDQDSLLLIDINGVVYQMYKDLPSPKDVLYYSSNPSQAVVATRKEAIILDLNTSKVVARSKLQGFYPWNIQYIKEQDIFAACDPSGERIVFLDKNLCPINYWLFNNQEPQQPYQKVYPYAAKFISNDTSFVLIHRAEECQLEEYDTHIGALKRIVKLSPKLKSFSIYADSARKCLIVDKFNHCLVSVNKDSEIEKYTCESMREPHSMTFLSTGTLCVTDSNISYGTSGGISIISETNLKLNQ